MRKKLQLNVNDILAQLGYGGLFANPFAIEAARDPKNIYRSAWDAYDKMLAWDPELAALDKVARFAVLSHDTEIVAATDDAESDKAADFCIEMISNIKNWEDIRYDLLDSPAKGLAVVQKNIVRDGSYYTIADDDNAPALQTLPQDWFYWKVIDGKPRLVYRGMYGGGTDEPLEEELFIIARHGYTVDNPYGRGYLTEAYWTFVKKKILQGYMLQLCERGVEPERWAQCVAEDEGGDLAWDQRDDIRTALEEFARHSEAVFPPGMELKYQPGDSGALQSELNFIHLLDNYLAKIVLGQTLTTDQGRTGSYELGKIHDLQQGRLTISRCKDEMADINDQLLTPICELNFNVGRAKLKIKYEKERDRKEEAEIWKILGETISGFKVSKEYTHFTFDIPEVEDAPSEEGEEDVDYYELGGSSKSEEPPGEPFGEPFGGFPAVAQKKNLKALAGRQSEANKRARLIDNQVARQVIIAKGAVDGKLREWKNLINRSRSYEDLTARVESRNRDWPTFAEALRKAAVASYALGWAMQARETTVKAAAAPEYDTWEDVLRAFGDKVPIDAETFYNLDMELRAKYFATAIAEDEYMATIIHKQMESSLGGGRVFSDFKQAIYKDFLAAGYEYPAPYRVNTVFRYHVGVADAAAHEDFYADPAVSDMLWGFEYLTAGDKRVRPEHAMLHGTREPKESAFWATNTPPLDFMCRCNKVMIMKDDAPQPNEAPEGWQDVPNRKYGFDKDPREMLRAMPPPQ